MSMNIAKLQSQLQHVPDQALIGYVQNPNGEVPSYLALAELTRRKEIRAAGTQQMPGQGKKPSIAEQTIASHEPGVAGLNLPDEMYSEKTMAAGGIVAFDDGGTVAYNRALMNSGVANAPFAGFGLAEDANNYIGGLGKDFIDSVTGLAWTTDPKTGKLIRKSDLRNQSKNEIISAAAKDVANQYKGVPSASPTGIGSVPIGSVTEALRTNKSAETNPLAALATRSPIADATPPKADVASTRTDSGNTPNRAFTPTKLNVPTVTATNVPYDQAMFDKLKEAPVTAQGERDRFNELIGKNEGLAALQERLAGMETKAKGEEEKAPWMALARAGLGMAAGKSPFALQNIAEGATAGMADYAAAKDKLAAAEEKRFGLQSQLAQAQRAEQLAAAKFGEDSAQHIKAQNHATDLAALTAKTTIDTTNASNQLKAAEANATSGLKAQELGITEKHYNDWYNVSKLTAEKSLQGIEKQGVIQQTQILNNLLDEANTNLKNISADMNATPQDRIDAQAKFDAIQSRLMQVGGVQYTPKVRAPAGKLADAPKGSGADFRFGF
jgi:hypothetical protein